MKVFVALLVFAACSAVRATNPDLSRLWHDGAALVPAPVTEVSVSGEQLRSEIIAAMDDYIDSLDANLEQQIAYGVSDILQPCGLRYQEIMNKQILVISGSAGPNEFDTQLWYLTRYYDDVVELVREGEGQKQRLGLVYENFEKSIKSLVSERANTRYTLSQLFYDYDQAVIARDFGILRKWLLDTFDAGYTVVHSAVPVMEENHRQKYMWPMVRSLQRDSLSIAAYDANIQAHSDPVYWREFVRARNDLWTL